MKRAILLLTMLSTMLFGNEVFMWVQYGQAAHDLTISNLDANPHIEEGLTALALQYWNTASDGSLPYIKDENKPEHVTYWVDRAHAKGIDVYMTVTCIYQGHAWNPYVVGALTENRAAYVKNMLDTVDHYNLDGIDIDLEASWRVGASEGADDLPILLKELKDSLAIRGKKVSVAIFAGDDPSWFPNYPQVRDAKEWYGLVDYINVMGYEGTYESYSNDRHHGELSYSYIISEFTKNGFDESAVNIGLPAYTSSWGSPAKGPQAHIQDINNLNAGVCIWDSKLGGVWTNAPIWAELKVTKDNGVTRYPVTATAGVGGKISPLGVVDVDSATNKTFTITPDLWFVVDDVVVDGSSVGPVTTHTITNVLGARSIEAKFVADPNAPNLYEYKTSMRDINNSAKIGGTIDPLGVSMIAEGSSFSFTSDPLGGYAVAHTTIDGEDYGPIVSGTFTNTYKNHTIETAFKEASGGDFGKYPEWHTGTQTPNGDTVFWNDSLWMYQGSLTAGGWGSGMTPSISLGDQFGTPPWKYAGLYNSSPAYSQTATLEYRSASNGKDTLIITTITDDNGRVSTKTDTTILLETSIDDDINVSKSVAGIQLIQNGLAFIPATNGVAEVELFDLRGRLIMDRSVSVQAGAVMSTGISSLNISRGVYLLVVSQDQLSIVQRIHQ